MGVSRKLLDGIWESVRGQSETHYKLLKRSSVLVTALVLKQFLFGAFVIYCTRSNYDIFIYSNEIYKKLLSSYKNLEQAEMDLKLQTF